MLGYWLIRRTSVSTKKKMNNILNQMNNYTKIKVVKYTMYVVVLSLDI